MEVWLRRLILSGVEVVAEIDGKIVSWGKKIASILFDIIITVYRIHSTFFQYIFPGP